MLLLSCSRSPSSPSSCHFPRLWLRLQQGMHCAVRLVFLVSALCFCAGEYCYSTGLQNGGAEALKLARQVWPFDTRFRSAHATLLYASADDAEAIPVLEEAKKDDPYAVGIRVALVIHRLRIGDQTRAASEMAELMVLAPKTELVKRWRGER